MDCSYCSPVMQRSAKMRSSSCVWYCLGWGNCPRVSGSSTDLPQMRLRRLVAKHVLASKMNIWYIASGTILVQSSSNLVDPSSIIGIWYCNVLHMGRASRSVSQCLGFCSVNFQWRPSTRLWRVRWGRTPNQSLMFLHKNISGLNSWQASRLSALFFWFTEMTVTAWSAHSQAATCHPAYR